MQLMKNLNHDWEVMKMIEQLAKYHPILPDITILLILVMAAGLAYFFATRVLLVAVRLLSKRTAGTWDDALINNHVGARLAQLVPVFIIFIGVELLPRVGEKVETFVLNLTSAYLIVVAALTIVAFLSAANDIYESNNARRQRSIKGFIQLLQLVVMVLGFLLFIAAVMDRSPVLLLSGFGAMAAVVLLIFKDTLLSLVASVQMTAHDMVRVGDWIEMPQFGADGDVVDVELHTVKVQNWDKTITTIPTHRLISDSFKNWRGMSDSGGRRIKRPLYLDAASVHFMTAEEIDRCKRFLLLEEYLDGKETELAEYNRGLAGVTAMERDAAVNMRRLTNIGTFRAYAYRYLRQHPKIRQNMTLMVRHLAPGPQGVPIEVYCFTATTVWTEYEDIQADIFDHLLTIIPEFGLRLYQQPAGTEFSIRQV
jgi:miniconductance mechanosensitive channel